MLIRNNKQIKTIGQIFEALKHFRKLTTKLFFCPDITME